MRFLALALALTLMACGLTQKSNKDEGGGAATSRVNGMTFADEASVPPCDAATQGFLIYVVATKVFKTCDKGQWAVVDITGPKGDKGDAAENLTAAIGLYKKYRRSVFRITLTCGSPVPGAPTSQCGVNPDPGVLLGTAFLCGASTLCTNSHVVTCNPQCYQSFTSVKVEALEDGKDTLNPDGTPNPPIATLTSASAFRRSTDTNRTVDLAKFDISGLPSGLTTLPLSTKTAAETIAPLTEIMSISYPLGLQDLYVDLGHVNEATIGECNTEGGVAGYQCPRDLYDFSTNNDTDHGSSGSPLIELSGGTVVGVTSAGTEGENANYTWAIDASRFSLVP